jgi:hypothetical protein
MGCGGRVGRNRDPELSEPLEPKEKDGVWSISFGAPRGGWERAADFDQSIRELLIEAYPALLSDYASGFNEYREKQRTQEAAQAPDPQDDRRSDAVKMREFADHLHGRPARFVEASLEGLARARHRV